MYSYVCCIVLCSHRYASTHASTCTHPAQPSLRVFFLGYWSSNRRGPSVSLKHQSQSRIPKSTPLNPNPGDVQSRALLRSTLTCTLDMPPHANMLNALLHPPAHALITPKPQPRIHSLHVDLSMNQHPSWPPAGPPFPTISSSSHVSSIDTRPRAPNRRPMYARPLHRGFHQVATDSASSMGGEDSHPSDFHIWSWRTWWH